MLADPFRIHFRPVLVSWQDRTCCHAAPSRPEKGKVPMKTLHARAALAFAFVAAAPFTTQADDAPVAHRIARVTLDGASDKGASGRLILFMAPAAVARDAAKDGKVDAVDTNPFQPK